MQTSQMKIEELEKEIADSEKFYARLWEKKLALRDVEENNQLLSKDRYCDQCEPIQKRLTKKELLDIFPEAVEYLEEKRNKCYVWLSNFETIIALQLDNLCKIKDEFSRWFWTEVLEATEGELLKKYKKKLMEINLFLDPCPCPTKKGKITEEDILRAKEYPFENLIKANKSGFALCPFHNDRKPSLYIKKNFYYCFACGAKGDTIDFLMRTEGISFLQAVRALIA